MIIIDGNYNIKMTRGDTFIKTLKLIKNGEPYEPQNGDVIAFGMAKEHKGNRGYKLLINKVIPNDTLIWRLDPADTEALPYGDYYYDLQITYADGKNETFANSKIFTLLKEVV